LFNGVQVFINGEEEMSPKSQFNSDLKDHNSQLRIDADILKIPKPNSNPT